jgi:hypothetical protein
MRERPINSIGLACADQGHPRAVLDANDLRIRGLAAQHPVESYGRVPQVSAKGGREPGAPGFSMTSVSAIQVKPFGIACSGLLKKVDQWLLPPIIHLEQTSQRLRL